jgi:uncharacterized protein YcbK (DUF882 family)
MRRSWILTVLAALIATAASAVPRPAPRRLAFYNTHTGESIDVVYWSNGRYQPQALGEIARVLRDHRTNEQKAMDVQLLDLLFELRARLDTQRPFHVISSYRAPESNEYLRGLSRTSGVAKTSQHMLGRAIDVRIPGLKIEKIRDVALQMRRGGVGYYPASDFVHVDVGRVRRW